MLAIWLSVSASGATQNQQATPSPAMTSEEALAFYTQHIAPALRARRDDPSEIPLLRARIQGLYLEGGRNPRFVVYVNDYARDNGVLLKNLYAGWYTEVATKKPAMYLFIPAFRDYMRTATAKQFEDYVALAFTHEMIHWELSQIKMFPLVPGPSASPETLSKGEAVAWGITILEVIRPMIQQGRIRDTEILIRSEELRKLKDNYQDPLWIAQFAGSYIKRN